MTNGRLILPLSYFIEKPFQSWARTSAAITGSVLLRVDHSLNVRIRLQGAVRRVFARRLLPPANL